MSTAYAALGHIRSAFSSSKPPCLSARLLDALCLLTWWTSWPDKPMTLGTLGPQMSTSNSPTYSHKPPAVADESA